MTAEELVFDQLTANLGYPVQWAEDDRAVVDGVVMRQVDDPSEKVFLCSYGGQARIQFDIYTGDRWGGLAIREALRSALRSIRGTIGGIRVSNVRIANEYTGFAMPNGTHRYITDAIITWEDA